MDVFEAKEIIEGHFKSSQVTFTAAATGLVTQVEFFIDSKKIGNNQGWRECEYVYGSGQRLVVISGQVTKTTTHSDGRPTQVTQAVAFVVRNSPVSAHDIGAHFDKKMEAIEFVDASLQLEKYFTKDPIPAINAELEKFQAIVDGYRSQDPRPTISEDARKFQVQAESAFSEEKYDDAVRLFRKALGLAPWWPEGHYSLALLYEQQQYLPHAYLELKKYLALVPDAADARKARDKLYVWEAKLESMVKRPQ